MKTLGTTLLLTFCLCLFTLNAAQVPTKSTAQGYSDFLIDPNKPYVYLEVDHVGPRKPLRNGEPNIGIWLRLKNNCKLPIAILAVGAPPKNLDGAITVENEIVPNPEFLGEGPGEDARMTGIIAPHELEEMIDVFHFPNVTEEEVKSAEAMQRNSKALPSRPLGYNSYNGFDAFGLTLIPPGGQAFFSVPINHVSKTWHFEIPFRLALPSKSRIRPPYSHVAFYQEDLKDNQGNAAPPVPTTH
jgi:hypothetical protein